MEQNNCILIVDDDVELAQLVASLLETNGFKTKLEHNGLKAVERISKEQPMLVLLDVMLPDLDGLSICRTVRSEDDDGKPRYTGPIIMLTAMDDDLDEVAGLEVGANDYLTKPVRSGVLLARVRALLRSHAASKPAKVKIEPMESVFSFGDIKISKITRQVTKQGMDIGLTPAEFELLLFLAGHFGKIISRHEIREHFRQLGYESTDRTIDLRVSRIRKKLSDDPKHPQSIKTIHGKGYMFALA